MILQNNYWHFKTIVHPSCTLLESLRCGEKLDLPLLLCFLFFRKMLHAETCLKTGSSLLFKNKSSKIMAGKIDKRLQQQLMFSFCHGVDVVDATVVYILDSPTRRTHEILFYLLDPFECPLF